MDDALSVSLETCAELQPSDVPRSVELPSQDFAVVPLAKSHPFAFGAVRRFLVSGKLRLDTNKLHLVEIYNKTF